ncbi:unnamed protein product [Leptidea sinapis]|uniref:Uncharacterized protein n=1 Tax=Leptidea sinapis TaxID=189913 RepID=A0A5E4Q506_9NEOP|nr:unnamed protein product [Leptidea sinapis]
MDLGPPNQRIVRRGTSRALQGKREIDGYIVYDKQRALTRSGHGDASEPSNCGYWRRKQFRQRSDTTARYCLTILCTRGLHQN